VFQIFTPIADLRKKNSNNSALETQLLYGEKISILEEYKNWSLVHSKEDNYKGWINSNNLEKEKLNTYKVNKVFCFIFKKPDFKSLVIGKLFFNSKIEVISSNDNWCEVFVNNKYGFIHKKSIISINKYVKDWVSISKMFLNVPYLWGGKTFDGIDCSGLVQLSLQFCGINFPRDTKDQIIFNSNFVKDTSKITRGCIIFWKGHVAISLNEKDIIHSNMYHLGVQIEKLKTAENRIGPISKVKRILS